MYLPAAIRYKAVLRQWHRTSVSSVLRNLLVIIIALSFTRQPSYIYTCYFKYVQIAVTIKSMELLVTFLSISNLFFLRYKMCNENMKKFGFK